MGGCFPQLKREGPNSLGPFLAEAVGKNAICHLRTGQGRERGKPSRHGASLRGSGGIQLRRLTEMQLKVELFVPLWNWRSTRGDREESGVEKRGCEAGPGNAARGAVGAVSAGAEAALESVVKEVEDYLTFGGIWSSRLP